MQDPRDDERPSLIDADGPAVPVDGDGDAAVGRLDERHAVVRRSRDLAVPADQAWDLLKDADGLSRWLAEEVDVVVAPGEHGHVRDQDGTERDLWVDEVDAGRRLALRWLGDDGDEALVDVVLEDLGDASRITVTEIPLRLVSIPDAVPAAWTIDGLDGGAVEARGGPQLLALACR